MALAMDNVDFVKLLLEYGVNISSFLTNEVLEFLHGYRSYDKSSPLRYEISEKDYKPYHMAGINANIYNYICSYNQLNTPFVAIPRKIVERVMQNLCSGLVKIEDEKFIEVSTVCSFVCYVKISFHLIIPVDCYYQKRLT